MADYEQLTWVEKAEMHLQASRELASMALQNINTFANLQTLAAGPAGIPILGAPKPPDPTLVLAVAQAQFTGSEAQATMAQTCALLAGQEGRAPGFAPVPFPGTLRPVE